RFRGRLHLGGRRGTLGGSGGDSASPGHAFAPRFGRLRNADKVISRRLRLAGQDIRDFPESINSIARWYIHDEFAGSGAPHRRRPRGGQHPLHLLKLPDGVTERAASHYNQNTIPTHEATSFLLAEVVNHATPDYKADGPAAGAGPWACSRA